MRSRFDEQLTLLQRELTQMGSMCEEVIALAAKALLQRDNHLLDKIDALEQEIDRMERTIETLCLKLILQQQPVASDLRKISAAHKMITDMERIGDQASDIADIVRFTGPLREDGNQSDIREIPAAAIQNVTESIDAYAHGDIALAEAAIAHDDAVDACFAKIRNTLAELIAAHPETASDALDWLMVAKYFERIGDHAVNIAEWVVFSVTGKHKGIAYGGVTG